MANSTRPWDEPSSSPAVDAGRAGAIGSRWAAAAALALRVALLWIPVALAASWLGFYLITGVPTLDIEAFRATILLHAVTALVFIPYLIYLIIARRVPGGSVLDAPVAFLLTAYLVATAVSLDWRVSLEVTLTALMAAGAFFVFSDGGLLRRWQLETALLLAVLAVAAKALWLVGQDYRDWLRLTDAVRGGLSFSDLIPPTVLKVHDVGDHPNLTGGILAMSLPLFLVLLFRSLRWPVKLAAVLAIVVVLLAMFLSLTRSAWLGAGAGVATTALLLLLCTPRGREIARHVWPSTPGRQILAGLATLLVAGVAVAAAHFAGSVEARPIWLFRESGTPRVDVMGAGAEMFQDYPLLGTGPGVYPLLYPDYSGKYPVHALHSHNGYLQTAVDTGAVGVGAMLALAAALAWLVVRGVRKTEGDARLTLAACAGAFVAFGVFSLFDAPNGYKAPLFALAAVGAVAVLAYEEGGAAGLPFAGGDALRIGQGVQGIARVAIPVALAGLLITWARLDVAHFYFSNSLGNANAQRWAPAIDDGERAVELDPQFAIYRFQLGVTQAQAWGATGDPALLDDAVYQLRRGLALEPHSAIGHVNLALLLSKAGRDDEARAEAQAALRFASNNPAIVLAAATALEQSGFQTDAVDAYALAISVDGNLAQSPFWSETLFRKSRYWEIVGHSALVFSPCTLLELTSADGLPPSSFGRDQAMTGCLEAVQTNTAGAAGRVQLASALIDDGRLPEARTLLDQVLSRQPDFGPARTGLGRWYAAQGDVAQARAQWLRAGQLKETAALVLLGDSYPAGQVPPQVVRTLRSELDEAASDVQLDIPSILYYRLKFFRAAPIAILLPGEWQHVVPARYTAAQDALERWQ